MKTLLVVLGLLIFSAGFGLARAQEGQEATPVLATEIAGSDVQVLQRDRLVEEIAQLKKTYRGQLSEYLQAEREFTIVRGQYHQLQTLASIDKVIAEAKEVMISRDQVLQTYFLLLETSLVEAEGIEIVYQEKTIERIKDVREWLKNHQEKVGKATDRIELNQLSDEIIDGSASVRVLAEHATTLLSVGKLQNVFDQIEAVEDKVFSEATESGEFSREQRETKRVMEVIELELSAVWDSMRKGIVEEFNVLAVSRNLIEGLNPVYAGLNKALGFVFEVVGL